MAHRQHDRRAVIKCLSALVVAIGLLQPATAWSATPQQVIEGLNAVLLEVMQSADSLGYAGRYQRLAPVLEESFDFPFMIRIASGRAWRDWSEDERRRVTEAFSEMSIATYAARFDGHSGERFEITGEGEGPRDSVLVQTRLLRPADGPVGIDYLLKESEGRWRIIDILLDAKFSELARQRAEFGAIVERGGAAALIESLEAKVAELASNG